MRIVLIGAVRSTEATLERLIAHGMNVVGVFGYRAPDVSSVSGYADLEPAARAVGIPFHGFRSVNDAKVIDAVRALDADLLFVVGLSQLVGAPLMQCARNGAVGYHPTALPEGRGRAPIAWMVLERRAGASTFFQLTTGADEGCILVQRGFEVSEDDDAGAVERKVLATLREALDAWLPRLKAGEWRPVPQQDALATHYGRRTPEDGLIDWHTPALAIDRLVKASSRPHPGAFTYRAGEKLLVWRSRRERGLRVRGVTGRILRLADDGAALVQTGRGLLWLLECETAADARPVLKVGEKLGFDVQIELHAMLGRLARLEGQSR
jgi:methionyl-tRNA formyltransferase